ncbi:lipase [Nocardia sp. NBC_01499]|uniref:esterase/lipase family protein n=1 Tax=Nocardia sp. NBC_01499 TaxID=2903597 RepID=UPI003863EF68
MASAAAAPPPVPFHVPWGPVDNVAGILPHVVDFQGTPPGANDWNCVPSAAHPEPVVLLSGTSAGPAQNYRWLSPLLANNGYCVFTLTYGIDPGTVSGLLGGLSLPGNADEAVVARQQLAPFVDRVLAATGAAKVDFVGHSQGTVMPRWYIKFLGGDQKVAKSINLAPLWNGTTLYGLTYLYQALQGIGVAPAVDAVAGLFSHSALQFRQGSDFLNILNQGEAFAPTVDYTNIITRYDEAVVPYTSGIAPPGPNITNIVLQDLCPNDFSEHLFVAADPIVGQHVLNALDPGDATPIDCYGTPRNSG